MLGMMCAVTGSSIYLTIATKLGLPVSTTHVSSPSATLVVDQSSAYISLSPMDLRVHDSPDFQALGN